MFFEHSHGKPHRSGTFDGVGSCFDPGLTFLSAVGPLKVFTFIHQFWPFFFFFQNLFCLVMTTWPPGCMVGLSKHPHLLAVSSPPILQWPLDLYWPLLFPRNRSSINKKTTNWMCIKFKKIMILLLKKIPDKHATCRKDWSTFTICSGAPTVWHHLFTLNPEDASQKQQMYFSSVQSFLKVCCPKRWFNVLSRRTDMEGPLCASSVFI